MRELSLLRRRRRADHERAALLRHLAEQQADAARRRMHERVVARLQRIERRRQIVRGEPLEPHGGRELRRSRHPGSAPRCSASTTARSAYAPLTLLRHDAIADREIRHAARRRRDQCPRLPAPSVNGRGSG